MAGKLRKLRERRGCGRKKRRRKPHHKKQEQLRRCKEKMWKCQRQRSGFLVFSSSSFPPFLVHTHTTFPLFVGRHHHPPPPVYLARKKRGGEKVGENGVSPWKKTPYRPAASVWILRSHHHPLTDCTFSAMIFGGRMKEGNSFSLLFQENSIGSFFPFFCPKPCHYRSASRGAFSPLTNCTCVAG